FSLFLNFRCSFEPREWFFISLYKEFYFIDLLFSSLLILVIIQLIKIQVWKIQKSVSINNYYEEDNPNYEENNYAFESLFKKINPVLFNDEYEKSFTIGLIGSWGSGKSSFLKKVEKTVKEHKNYKKKEIIFIDFPPFLNHNEEQVIHEFFVGLSNELSFFSSEISPLLNSYSEKLSNAVKDKNVFSFFKPNTINYQSKSASELYKEIDEVIKKLGKKIIVSIDDLDRLNEKEILQVLKLIRNTSNFSNVVFIVAIDKEYIVETLSTIPNNLESNYLDKFLQLEIRFYSQEKQFLSKSFAKSIKGFNCNEQQKNILDDITKVISENEDIIGLFLKNHRDLKRFRNQIVSELDFLIKNISNLNLLDFIAILLIEQKSNAFYNILLFKWQLVFDLTWAHQNNNGFIPIDELHQDESFESKKFNKLSLKENFFEKLKENCLYKPSETHKENILKLLKLIFDSENQVNSIQYIDKFELLINRIESDKIFNSTEFRDLIKKVSNEKMSYSDFEEILRPIISGIKAISFEQKINDYYPEDKEDFENYIKFLILLLVDEFGNPFEVLKKVLNTKKLHETFGLNETDISQLFIINFFDSRIIKWQTKWIFLESQNRVENKIDCLKNYLKEFCLLLFKEIVQDDTETIRIKTKIIYTMLKITENDSDLKFQLLNELLLGRFEPSFIIEEVFHYESSNSKLKLDNDFFNYFIKEDFQIEKLKSFFKKVIKEESDLNKIIDFFPLIKITKNSAIQVDLYDFFSVLGLEKSKFIQEKIDVILKFSSDISFDFLTKGRVSFSDCDYELVNRIVNETYFLLSVKNDKKLIGLNNFVNYVFNGNKHVFENKNPDVFKIVKPDKRVKKKQLIEIVYISHNPLEKQV
ncbi:MAG: hypothetical protein FGM14_14750, partial [Flavobacteriales bacterium]|nr:hypothetical protein [Flavobacteriales bacterium]